MALIGTALLRWVVGARRRGGRESHVDVSLRLREAAERLGPTYIKLAQIISSGEGLFPEELVSEFRKCRDQVPPERFSVVRQVVEEDLGRPLEAVFSRFHPSPLAAASIAQVHEATLHTGEDVVVKVQRPSVGELVHKDLKAMAWIAPFPVGRIPIAALANPPALVELFAETITEELDFRIEAENMLDVARVVRRARPARLRDPPSPPHARHAAGAGDGAPVRLHVRRRGGHEGRRGRHRGRGAHGHGRLHGGRA